MLGKWKGYYKHENKVIPKEIRSQKTIFYINIEEFANNEFKGIIEEDPDSGGMSGVGIISGFVKNNQISFIKEMPIETILLHGKLIETNNKHPKLYYKGNFNELNNLWEGTWKFKIGITRVNGRLIIRLPVKGIWEMKKYKKSE